MSDSDDNNKMSEDEEERDIKEEPKVEIEDEEMDDDDIMKILVATDIHLGYEQTTKRAQEDDSFRAFEEILQYAKSEEVDMILLGGDLFHEAKPPHNVVKKCLELFRTYCLGDRPVKISFLTDPAEIFDHCDKKVVNYEDPNLNVEIPVFSIHGNHDDPSFGAVGSMDVLGASGLINYFGKWTDVTQVSITPIILKKGLTTIALYGLSYMSDQRLSRLMRTRKFKLLQSDEIQDAFNIFVLHQNRAQHTPKTFVPEDLLPDFLNLVIWGHEHECLINPEPSKLNPKVYISQPGSSVATSLAQGESVQKKIGVLNVYKNKFKMKLLDLKTVRPFVFEDLFLGEHKNEISAYKSRSEAVEEFVDDYIENKMIPLAAEQQTGHPQQPEKPLLRLRIFYSDDRDLFDVLKLSQKYYHVAANPNDMILFRKCSAKLKKKDVSSEEQDFGQVGEIFRFGDTEKDWKKTVQGGMTDYFSQDDQINKLTVLSLTGLNNALDKFVNANDIRAFHDVVKHQMEKTVQHLMKGNYQDKNEVLDAIKEYRNLRLLNHEEEQTEEELFLKSRKNLAAKTALDDLSFNGENENEPVKNEDDDNVEMEPPPTRGKGRGRGRGRGRGASSKAKDSSPAKRAPRGRSKNTTALDISTSGGNQSLSSWKKSSQSTSTSKRQATLKPIILDSDSD